MKKTLRLFTAGIVAIAIKHGLDESEVTSEIQRAKNLQQMNNS